MPQCVGDLKVTFWQGGKLLKPTCEKFGNSDQETHDWQKAERKGDYDTESIGGKLRFRYHQNNKGWNPCLLEQLIF